MHKYLRAIGFSEVKSKFELSKIVEDIIASNPEYKKSYCTDYGTVRFEYTKLFSDSAGIVLRMENDSDLGTFFEFIYPICLSEQVSTSEELNVDKYVDKDMLVGVCDDSRIGVTLIFDVQNNVDLIKKINDGNYIEFANICFSGLSIDGTIMFPIKKNLAEKEKSNKINNDRRKLINAARNGDESAIESLTLDDIDTYTVLSRKIKNDDIYSLVDSSFMPYGVECNLYSILGEILYYKVEKNRISGEELYVMDIDDNGLLIKVCINKKDLLGEPEIGRRFKGVILLQGKVLL